MERKIRIWAIGSAAWALIMLGMSFQDFRYGLEYHLFHSRVQAAYQEKLTAYEQARREGEADIRSLLQAAKRYDRLQFLALTEKRKFRPSYLVRAKKDHPPGEPRSEYQRTLDEISALESTYGKAALIKYHEQDGMTEQSLRDELDARLIVPRIREPRLGAVLFHMIALPLVILLALWMRELDYRHLPLFRRMKKRRAEKE